MHILDKENDELISIIIPVFNCEKTIERCISTIREQTYKNLEIILVDDGSMDNSEQKIKEQGKQDSRILYIKKKNAGVSSARNKGLEFANGKYIAFVDADDYVEVDYVETLYEALIRYGADISLCYPNDEYDSEECFVKVENRKCVPVCFSVDEGFTYLKRGYCHWVSWGALYKKTVIKDIDFAEDLWVAEDSLFFAQAVKNSKSIVHTNQILYHYVIYESSASHGSFDIKKYSELEAWKRICQLFSNDIPLYYSAKVAYSIRCRNMILKYYFDEAFTEEKYLKVKSLFDQSQRYILYFPGKYLSEWIKGYFFRFFPKLYIYLYRLKK